MTRWARCGAWILVFLSWQIAQASGEELAAGSQVEGDSTAVEIRNLLDQANALIRSGELDTAMTLGHRAGELVKAMRGERDTLYASALTVIGAAHYYAGRYPECEAAWRRASRLRHSLLPDDHPDRGRSWTDMGVVSVAQGKLNDAEVFFTQALDLRKKILPPDHTDRLISMQNLSGLLILNGKYAEGEQLLTRTIRLTEKMYGEDNPEMALTLINLGLLMFYQGRYDEAVGVFNRSVELLRQGYGDEHPALPVILHNLANTLMVQEKYAEAESVYIRTLDAKEKLYGTDHTEFAVTLSHLGEIYRFREDYERADSLFEIATDILEKEGGHYLGTCLTSLGNSLYDQGKYSEARPLYERALSTWESTLFEENPLIAEGLGNLARNSCALGNHEQALRYFERRHRTRTQFIESVFSYASEDQKTRYIRTYPMMDDWLLSFALIHPTGEVKEIAADMVIAAKALVVDALAAERTVAFCASDESLLALTGRHRELSGEIATLTLEGVDMYDPSIYRERLKTLHAERDSLEVELSSRCTRFREDLAAGKFTSSDLMSSLPEGCLYLDYVLFEPYDFTRKGTEKARQGPPRYLAVSIEPEGTVTLRDLGEGSEIDSLVLRSRRMITTAKQAAPSPGLASLERKLGAVTGQLYEKVIVPVEEDIEGKSDLYICPDGQLNLVPFEIIRSPDEKYMIEHHSISYLTSGRDWLRFQEDRSGGELVVVLADPDFSSSVHSASRDRSSPSSGESADAVSASETREVSDCLERGFAPLPNTRREAERISAALREQGKLHPDIYTGASAREEVVKTLDSPPKLLHLSTHGFFCEDVDGEEHHTRENPLLRSGLVFAGADNAVGPGRRENGSGEDGILTAFEVSGLNLIGTELVVLSACETGIGEIVNGEGVYGLRRTFHYAGAGAIIMSLWKVPDSETSDIMTEFYERWLSGESKKEAIRQASLAVLRDDRKRFGFSHPVSWGGFILAGDPR